MDIPTRADEDSFPCEFYALERIRAYCHIVAFNDHCVEMRNACEWQIGQVLAVGIAVKRAVEICAGVTHHFYRLNREFVAVFIQ